MPKLRFIIIFLAFSIGGGFFLLANFASHTSLITIESEESKTHNLTSVFNQIKYISNPSKDVWMMNQSHYGIHASKGQWERLAIVIDKTQTPKVAKFYQLTSGPLEWSDDLIEKKTAYRASCFTCHSNGPRGIRPVSSSSLAPLNISSKLKVFIWNLRIKTYGRIHYDKSHDQEDIKLNTPFRFKASAENDELKVATCVHCHKEDGLFARGALVRQQIGTIKHMVDSGHMPPPGFTLSKNEKKELQDFFRGF